MGTGTRARLTHSPPEAMENIKQTHTPWRLVTPNKDALVKEFFGKSLNELRTPALVVDRAAFRDNCAKMHENAKAWGASFRAHLKTHKVIHVSPGMQLVILILK